jgi:hypothetical protein
VAGERADAVTLYPAAPALVLLAAPAEGVDAETLAERLRDAFPHAEVGVRLGGHLPKARPDGSGALPLLPSPHAAILLSRGPEVFVSVNGLDPMASVTMAGTLHDVRPGDGAILVVMLATRRAELSRAAFAERWLDGHAPFGLRTDACAYRQLHASAEDGFDGIGMVWFRDLDHVASARAAPEIARDATADEMLFIDHSRSMLAMFRMAGRRES